MFNFKFCFLKNHIKNNNYLILQFQVNYALIEPLRQSGLELLNPIFHPKDMHHEFQATFLSDCPLNDTHKCAVDLQILSATLPNLPFIGKPS